jgi:transposase-like protein
MEHIVSQKHRWRKFSPEFRQKALEQMKTCSNVSELARQLGIRRKWLYEWRDAERRSDPAGQQRSEQDRQIAELEKRIASLQQLAGRQAAEIDFFKGALRRIKELRQRSGESGGAASTTKSEA